MELPHFDHQSGDSGSIIRAVKFGFNKIEIYTMYSPNNQFMQSVDISLPNSTNKKPQLPTDIRRKKRSTG